MAMRTRETKIVQLLQRWAPRPVDQCRVLEIGCGTGTNLLELLRLGFAPDRLVGNDLLEERVAIARERLPRSTTLLTGDAVELDATLGQFDIVYQSTVFTSVLDPGYRRCLANRMRALVAPGGGILWYDFTHNNPKNRDVRRVTVRELRALFPGAVFDVRRVTLAPPIARVVAPINPLLYDVLHWLPVLRTHCLCWIQIS